MAAAGGFQAPLGQVLTIITLAAIAVVPCHAALMLWEAVSTRRRG